MSGISCLVGCGTILHPERRGQRAGNLDCGVILLDGLGLLLFFVPGVIAFAVDFGTGAIYLPEGEVQAPTVTGNHRNMKTLSLPKDHLSRIEVAKAVSNHTGQLVTLEAGEYRTAELQSIQDFWPTMERLQTDGAVG